MVKWNNPMLFEVGHQKFAAGYFKFNIVKVIPIINRS